ncbi:flavohemoprotein [Aspergillus ruber CBS 135680]|uniref:nitric oxide dioxygenase n=1 Tax=Aspergillus ruber (strain CBS 135680) TaxID=1388766 RepID=A0A017S2W9_ASPRC|nr:flavohemo protein [Aspergillus ruber CBS 135680]EYE90505.1 flavohemo protein [Aspergillus ruber CBS 135680]
MSLTPEQTEIIKATVPVVKEHGNTITTVFYKNMLEAHPELNAIFNTTNQVNGHQPRALAGALFAYASNIDNLGALGPAVELICNKHASLYIQPEHYGIVGKFLLEAMGQVLGDALTPEILDAWAAAYWQLANLFIGRESDIYKQNEGWTQWREFKVAQKVPESAEITSFYLKPVDEKPLPRFRPGQYISIQVQVPQLEYPQARQYSLSDMPRDDYYRISVKKETGLNTAKPEAKVNPGYVSNILHETVNEGDVVEVSHPCGDFFLTEQEPSHPIVLVAAGVGLTPLTSMFNTLTSTPADSQRKIHFIHGARTTSVRAFKDQIKSRAEQLPNLRATFFTSSPSADEKQGVDYDVKGRIDVSKMDANKDLFLDNAQTEFYICGPTTFMNDISNSLKARGVASERVHMELFGTGGVPV